jgi:hypothetical protein
MKRLIIGLVLMALLLAAVSCAKAPPEIVPTPVPAPEEGPSVRWGGDEDKGSGTMVLSTTDERMIVRTGEMSLVVEGVTQAVEEIAQLAVSYGGYVVSSSISGEEEDMRGRISIRVPDEKFDQALAELRNRLNNAEATEQQYLAILEKAEDVEDILKVYDSLSRVRQEIEQIKGRMLYLERTSSTSLISVRLEPEATAKPLVRAGWSALETLKSAVRGIVTFGQWLGVLVIWLIIFIPVWGTILGIILWRRHRRKIRG